ESTITGTDDARRIDISRSKPALGAACSSRITTSGRAVVNRRIVSSGSSTVTTVYPSTPRAERRSAARRGSSTTPRIVVGPVTRRSPRLPEPPRRARSWTLFELSARIHSLGATTLRAARDDNLGGADDPPINRVARSDDLSHRLGWHSIARLVGNRLFLVR